MNMAVTCDICNAEISTYTIKIWGYPVTIENALTGIPSTFDAVDCPKCGCQKILKRRYPKNEGGK